MPIFRALLVCWLFLLALPLQAQEQAAQAAGPREVIKQSIDRITARIDKEREQIKADPAYARKVVEEEIGDLVDFKRITRLVMASHFREASREQKYRFLDVFRDSLINTYSSGLTLYEGQKINVLPQQPGDVSDGHGRVRTEIQTSAGKVIPVNFSLYQDKEGHWLVENVIVNGLNLGKTFRSQFDQSVQQYQGDLDQVIAHWSAALDTGKPQQAVAGSEGGGGA